MRSESEDIQELQELEKQQEEITRKRNVILKRLEKRIRFSSTEIKRVFPSKIAAVEYVLKQAESPQHIKKITAEIAQFGFVSHERTISGMLRNYARQGKIFTAEKGNKFGLTDWSKKNS